MATGTLVKLDDSDGEIDTSDQLNMFEAYQKAFIVNGANRKVVDFVNTRLTSDAQIVANIPSHGDILKQDQTGLKYAYMVVDYIYYDTITLKHYVYGYAYYDGTTAFDDAHNVVDLTADANVIITGGNLSDVAEASTTPHWYDWKPYNGDEITYGKLPNKAYLACLYRGRCVVAGDPEHPHQWYMSRQANPWDFAYVANDAQSPVAGGNADAGESGDIIRALISYKDDYLVFGCATSIWFLAGDPCEGGSINELDLTTGMFGANSWCFDGLGNLFFWGTNGIYVTSIPGTPKCLSEQALPQLVGDENVDPSTHRITMAYDRTRAGILICITRLADGKNSNYFYDLISGGFFPESYADECGAYSLFYYAANNRDYRDLLIGCKDGYIRKFNDSLKNDNDSADDPGVGTVKIDSYVTFGPIPMARDQRLTGKLTGLNCITAGGASGGSDSNDVSYSVFVGSSAEEVVEKLSAGVNPNAAGIIKAPGRNRSGSIHRKISGVYLGVKLQNNTIDEMWGLEQLLIDLKPGGKFK